MLQINQTQKEFYEFDAAQQDFEYRGNPVGRLWAKLRSAYGTAVNSLGEFSVWSRLHWKWMGDLSDKKVLDLGCHTGNYLSVDIARRSREYVGLDLSESATDVLRARLEAEGVVGARVIAADFLSDAFAEREFDVVYAQSMFHHFEYMGSFLARVHEVLAPGGIVVTSDPMATYMPLRVLRALYRPFQRDRAWEHPFTRQTFDEIQRFFVIEDLQGFMGRTKWILLVYPFSERAARRLWSRWLKADLTEANRLGPALWRCMRVTLKLRKRLTPS